MAQGLADQAAILVHQVTGSDGDQVAAEAQQPAGEGVGAADPEVAAIGVAGDLFAQPVRGGRGAGAAPEVDGRHHRVARAQPAMRSFFGPTRTEFHS